MMADCGVGGETIANTYNYLSSEVCETVVNGPSSDPYNRICVSPGTVFTEGDTVFSLSKIGNVYVDHQWKVDVYRDGVKQWDAVSNMVLPDHDYGWQYSIFETSISNALAGDYLLKVYLDSGSGFELMETKEFTVPDTKPDYVYQNAAVCEDITDGPPGDIYNLQPVNENLYIV